MLVWLKQDRTPEYPNNEGNLQEGPLRKRFLYKSVLSLLSALSFLHQDVGGEIALHLDLKPGNILLFGSTWKICDFGKSRLKSLTLGTETEGKDGIGSPKYQPPEYFDKNIDSYGRSFDLWAMGCIIFELAIVLVYGWETEMCRKLESELSNENGVFSKKLDLVYRWISRLDRKDGSQNLQCLMNMTRTMLSTDPTARPYSWEVQLNLEDQLKQDDSIQIRKKRMEELVQRPENADDLKQNTPVTRAVALDHMERVEYLLDVGWLPTLPVDSAAGASSQTTRYINAYEPPANQIERIFFRAFPDWEDWRYFSARGDFSKSIKASELTDLRYDDIDRLLTPREKSLDPEGTFQDMDVMNVLTQRTEVDQKTTRDVALRYLWLPSMETLLPSSFC